MSLTNYFSIYTKKQSLFKADVAGNEEPGKPSAFFQWFALLFGVLIQPFFSFYKEKGSVIWGEAYQNWEFLIFAVIIAIIAFPGIYRMAFDSDRPKWIQMIPIFTAGLGWQTLVDSAIAGATGGTEANGVAIIAKIGEYIALCT